MSVTSTPKGSDLSELERVLVLTRKGVDELQDRRIALENLDYALSLISAARKGQGEWRGIESAPKDDPILASISGKVWFQANWDEDDGEWVTFNRYLESDPHQPRRKFEPTIYMPLPPPPELGE